MNTMTSTTERATLPGRVRRPQRSRGVAVRSLTAALKTWRGRIGAALALLVIGIAVGGPFFPKHFSSTDFVATPFSPPGTNGALLGTDRLGR